ncbi:hypothetical protein LAA29_80003 [Leuconostoc carnosum]|nr:hypothetical protein LAA29_80003 [Leuconostoc carnosum]
MSAFLEKQIKIKNFYYSFSITHLREEAREKTKYRKNAVY